MINAKFVSQSDACQLLLTEDDYLKKLDSFNLKLFGFKDKDSMKNAFNYCVEDYHPDAKAYILKILDLFNNKMAELFPHQSKNLDVSFIMSNGKECGLPYTRQGYIVLIEQVLFSSHLVLHEMFHVLTRQNPEFQNYLYERIGFKNYGYDALAKHEIKFVLNPDAPNNNYYVEIDGKKVTPYANSMNVRDLKFLVLNEKNNVVICNTAQLEKISDQYYNLFEPVSYLLHPEEILAEAWSAFWHRQLDLRSYFTPFLKNDSHLYKVIQDSLEKYVLVK